MAGSNDLSRRDVLKITAGTVVAGQVAALAPALAAPAVKPALKFFTSSEFALVDALADILIPADDHTKGARAAAAAHFIDGRLASLPDDTVRSTWRSGLQKVDALSATLHGHGFMVATPEERVAVVTRMAENEGKPTTDEEKFFVELKARTVHAYYTSSIGIHDEMEYKGNVLLQDFAGTDVSHT
jgi:hypothetical protein